MHPATDSMLDGGPGFDILVLDYSTSSSVVLSADQLLSRPGIVGIEAIDVTGSPYSDVLSGSPFGDRLLGGGGFDVLRGGGGNDYLDAGPPGPSTVGVPEGGKSTADALPLDYLFSDGPMGPTLTLGFEEPQYFFIAAGIAQPLGSVFSFTVAEAGDRMWIDWNVPFLT